MYNTTTRSYTLADASGSLDWIVETMEPADMTDEEITEWVDTLIDNGIEQAGYDLDADIEKTTFPVMGYSTTQIFQDEDEYRAFKLAEIESDLNAERETVTAYIKAWIAGDSPE